LFYRRVIGLIAWAVYVKLDLSTLVVDLGLTGLPNTVGIDTVRIVIPRLKIPLIFESRPHAPQSNQGRARGGDEGPRICGGPMASVKQFQADLADQRTDALIAKCRNCCTGPPQAGSGIGEPARF
jgi:hypothetical protein